MVAAKVHLRQCSHVDEMPEYVNTLLVCKGMNALLESSRGHVRRKGSAQLHGSLVSPVSGSFAQLFQDSHRKRS